MCLFGVVGVVLILCGGIGCFGWIGLQLFVGLFVFGCVFVVVVEVFFEVMYCFVEVGVDVVQFVGVENYYDYDKQDDEMLDVYDVFEC